MTAQVEITTRDGWHKEVPIQKAIIYIGSDPRNDIPLEPAYGGGVSSRHIQLIAAPGSASFRLVNVGDSEVLHSGEIDAAVSPRSFADVSNGDRVRVGEFILTFRSAAQAMVAPSAPTLMAGSSNLSGSDSARAIGLNISLNQAVLTTTRPIEGVIRVRNLGDRTGAQFRVDLDIDGFDPKFIEVGPGPILYPGAEADVQFRVYHPQSALPASGEYTLRARISAPSAYPGESAAAAPKFRLAHFYLHKATLTVPD